MLKEYKNKQISKEDTEKLKVEKKTFTFPEHGVVIEAETQKEAEEILSKQLKENN